MIVLFYLVTQFIVTYGYIVLFKAQQAATGPTKYSGPIDVANSLFRDQGIRSIYKGTCSTFLGGKIFTGAYISVAINRQVQAN